MSVTTYTSTPSRRSARSRVVGALGSGLPFVTAALLVTALVEGAPQAAVAVPTAAQQSSAVHQSVKINVLPPIAQPGARTASPAGARTVVTATVRPNQAGRPAVLERREHGNWKAVGRAPLRAGGRVSFTAPGSGAAVYRVRAAAYHGLPGVQSRPARANAWGRPAFVDQFRGKALGPAWEQRGQDYNPSGGRAGSKGDPAAVKVGGGALRLSVLKDPARAGERFTTHDDQGKATGSFAYRLNGHVSTQSSFDFQYGVAAARMKFQRRRGQHASFWMQPRGLGVQALPPDVSEIDVVEWYGTGHGRGQLATNIYPLPYGAKAYGGRIPDDKRYLNGSRDSWWTGYHVFSVEWTPDKYIFRIDGRETMRTTRGVSHHPEFLILSMLSSDYELRALGGDKHLPQHAYVDWVQVWPKG